MDQAQKLQGLFGCLPKVPRCGDTLPPNENQAIAEINEVTELFDSLVVQATAEFRKIAETLIQAAALYERNEQEIGSDLKSIQGLY
jgi:hypothetical protein